MIMSEHTWFNFHDPSYLIAKLQNGACTNYKGVSGDFRYCWESRIWISVQTLSRGVFSFTICKPGWLVSTKSGMSMSPFGMRVQVKGCGKDSKTSCFLTNGIITVSADFTYRRNGTKDFMYFNSSIIAQINEWQKLDVRGGYWGVTNNNELDKVKSMLKSFNKWWELDRLGEIFYCKQD